MRIYKENEALVVLSDDNFIQAWDRKINECPWSTSFQRSGFVKTWYNTFPEFIPIVITDWNGESLKGVLTLTIEKAFEITAAGLSHAEYQVWISSPKDSDKFIQTSLELIEIAFSKHKLNLKYIPANTPIQWLFDNPKWKNAFSLNYYQQPILEINRESLIKELNKKNRKEKINRLKKLGEIQFETINTKEEFLKVIDELAIQSDFRKGAMYDKVVFLEKPNLKFFFLELFELGLLHVTLFKLNGKIIASNAGIIGENIVHLQGINTHSPFYSKYSPGILHFLMLGIELENQGFQFFDLTPGGIGGYKEMLATTFNNVYELKFKKKWDLVKFQGIEFIKSLLKRLIGNKFLFNESAYEIEKRLRISFQKLILFKNNPSNFISCNGLNKVLKKHKKIYFKLPEISHFELARSLKFKKNCLDDLLFFDEREACVPRWEFLQDCMKRIEFGHNFYTVVKNNSLTSVLWYIPINGKSGEISNNGMELFKVPTLAYSYYSKDSVELIDFLFIVLHDIKKNKIETSNLRIQMDVKQTILLNKWKIFS